MRTSRSLPAATPVSPAAPARGPHPPRVPWPAPPPASSAPSAPVCARLSDPERPGEAPRAFGAGAGRAWSPWFLLAGLAITLLGAGPAFGQTTRKWIENPIALKVQIGVTNLYADSQYFLQIVASGRQQFLQGAGTDEFGEFIPTNYAPVTSELALRRKYPMSILCPNSGPDGNALLRPEDVDPSSFLYQLTNPLANMAELSQFLLTNNSPNSIQAFLATNTSDDGIQTNLALRLNPTITGPCIYTSGRFDAFTNSLSTSAYALLQQHLQAQYLPPIQLAVLNHLLLSAAYGSGTIFPCASDPSGTAELSFAVQPPPELKIKKGMPPATYSVLINDVKLEDGVPFVLHHLPLEGYCSKTNFTIEILQDQFAHYALADGCDDTKPAPGDGKWLELGPGSTAETNRISLAWSVALGHTFDGLSAGRLAIRELGLARDVYTPHCLFFNAASTNIFGQAGIITTNLPVVTTNSLGNLYTNDDFVLRQIKTCQAFVDILTPDTNQMVLNFYHPDQVAANQDTNGVYTSISGDPFVTWTIQNPQPATTDNLTISESRNGATSTTTLVKTTNSSGVTWTLRYGSSPTERVETRQVVFQGAPTAADRIETDIVRYGDSGTPAYQCVETYHFYDWGSELKQTIMPGLQPTVYDYYTDTNDVQNYAKLKQIVYPDGYWEKRVYGGQRFGLGSDDTVPLQVFQPYFDGEQGGVDSPKGVNP